MSRDANGRWLKGHVTNPKGRPPILLPALQKEIDENKGKLKELILRYCGLTEEQITQRVAQPDVPIIETIIGRILQEAAVNGDVDRARKLLEIPFGKLPEERPEFETTHEEKELILEYRRRLEAKKIDGPDSNSSD